ncbi:hypothetical protein ACFU51_34445 [Streptomyces sp. NPDC057430]|uniref:hypothetical protein n=1 Tax=Streptomyces sp. NPDC057430 TaxID=3346131 RepID=UPI00369FB270
MPERTPTSEEPPPRRPRRETVTRASALRDSGPPRQRFPGHPPSPSLRPGGPPPRSSPSLRPGGPPPRSARSEISEQTTLGHTYVRSLMRSQLRAALTALGALALCVGPLPLLLALPAPEAFVWIALGVGVYPVIWAVAHWYVRRAERNERDFTGLVEGR